MEKVASSDALKVFGDDDRVACPAACIHDTEPRLYSGDRCSDTYVLYTVWLLFQANWTGFVNSIPATCEEEFFEAVGGTLDEAKASLASEREDAFISIQARQPDGI